MAEKRAQVEAAAELVKIPDFIPVIDHVGGAAVENGAIEQIVSARFGRYSLGCSTAY